MTEQPSLFDGYDDLPEGPRAHARRTDPVESHQAAASVDVKPNQAAVLRVLREVGPVTDAALVTLYQSRQAVDPTSLPVQSPSGIRTRRKELVEAERVRDSGARVRLDSGRWAAVWEVAP